MKYFKQLVQISATLTAAALMNTALAQQQDMVELPTFAEVEQQAMELKQSVLTYSEEQRDALVSETESALTSFDRRIENLEENIAENGEEMSAAAKRYADNMMATLERQREELASWFASLKQDGNEAWDDVIYGFSSAYDEFYDSWENLEAQFGSSEA